MLCIDDGGHVFPFSTNFLTQILITFTLHTYIQDGDGGGSVSSSTLSSSSSGSSSSSDSDDSSESSSSSSESSDSDDDSSSSSDSDDDDDDESSSDDDSSSEEEGEVKDDDDSLDSSSSGDSSDDTIEAADRETKELFDADLSSDDEKESVKDTAEADDKRRKRRLKKKSKMLKAFKKKDDAANMIATHWKKKKSIGSSSGGKEGTPDTPGGNAPKDNNNDEGEDFSPEKKSPKEDTVSKTVESPSPEILQHIRTMSTKLQRKNIQSGLRVKVRFVKKANINGRLTRKLKWYGGVVAGIANGGRKIKIQYDDGTSEVADFPDKDIIVDDVNNGRHNCGSGGVGIVGGGGGGDPGGAFVPLPPSPTKSEENDDDGVEDDESNESEEEVDDTPMDPDSPEKKKVKKKKKKKDTGEERSEENVVPRKKKKKRASEDHGDDGHSSNLPLGDDDDDGLDSGALQKRRRSSNSERSDRDTKKKRGSLSDVSGRDEMKRSKRRESTSDMSISSNGEQTDTSPIKMKPAQSSAPGNNNDDAGTKSLLSEKGEEVVEEGTAEGKNLSQDDKSAEVDIAKVPQEFKGDDGEMPFVPPKDDSKDTKEEFEKLKPEDVLKEDDVAEEKVEKDVPTTTPSIDNAAASSSSGSTCSNSSFAGVAAPIATNNVDGNVLDSATDDVKLPSHVDVQVEKGDQTVPGTDEQGTGVADDDEKVQGKTADSVDNEGTSVRKSGTDVAEDQESQEKPPPKKKRGPLSIRIGLPKRKKQEHNQTDDDDADVGAAASELNEPSKKKQKLAVEGDINPSSELENDETLESNNKPVDVEETHATKGDNDDSLSDGEIEEEGEVQEEGGKIEEDGTMPMEVEPAKVSQSLFAECPSNFRLLRLFAHLLLSASFTDYGIKY